MMRVLHVITGLGGGGAEATLTRLVQASAGRSRHAVLSLMDEGVHGHALREAGCTVHALGFPRGGIRPGGLLRLGWLLRTLRPDVVQTWMYHADLLGGLAARLACTAPVVWGIHNADLDPARASRSARAAAWLCARLSGRVPRAIVSCSVRAAVLHRRLGYAGAGFVVVPNGYDLQRFRFRPEARLATRARWGVAPQQPVLGMLARWDPQKDHGNLLDALARTVSQRPGLVCVLAGTGMEASNVALMQCIDAHGLRAHVRLEGRRDDVPELMAGLDLHVLSSAGEAFPNVVAEAMACGTPCVVTDVGDAAAMVGALGWVVPPRDAQALAGAIETALASATVEGPAREVLRADCQRWVAERFGLARMVDAYHGVWERAMGQEG